MTCNLTKDNVEQLRDWVHDAIEGCDGDFLEISNTIEELIRNYTAMRDFKLQEMSPSAERNSDAINITDVIYCTECPFRMGYDYFVDMGAACHVWNTACVSAKDMLTCIEHHYKYREPQGALQDLAHTWYMDVAKGPDHSVFIHIEADKLSQVEDIIHRIWMSIDIKKGTIAHTSSFGDDYSWYLKHFPKKD